MGNKPQKSAKEPSTQPVRGSDLAADKNKNLFSTIATSTKNFTKDVGKQVVHVVTGRPSNLSEAAFARLTVENQSVHTNDRSSNVSMLDFGNASGDSESYATMDGTVRKTSSLKEVDSTPLKTNGYHVMPRGGFVVETCEGNIQFGIPPETIKDSLSLGMPVPKIFVILGEMFDRTLGLSKAEFEFPIYYQFFVLKSKVNIVTTKELETRIRTALRETLVGPGTDANVGRDDYPENTPLDMLPDFVKEAVALDPARDSTKIDDVVEFTTFDPISGCTVGGVEIRPALGHVAVGTDMAKAESEEQTHSPAKGRGSVFSAAMLRAAAKNDLMYLVCENDVVKAVVPPEVDVVYLDETVGAMSSRAGGGQVGAWRMALTNETSPTSAANRLSSLDYEESADEDVLTSIVKEPLPSKFVPFDIPVFGVTMLGASHGFDANGRTTGFVLWLNRKGVMVDPPPNSSNILETMGIPPNSIEALILTHTHADHDAGSFQKILRTSKVRLYTTTTIHRSFVKKYAAITGFEESFLRDIFQFEPVIIGKPLDMYGASLEFFYAWHTIPCVGFSAKLANESMIYSADTKYDPAVVRSLVDEGLIAQGRAEQLANFSFDHSVVLHEMGVPPIHTAKENLVKAVWDADVQLKPRESTKSKKSTNANSPNHETPLKERLFVVHASMGTASPELQQCRDWDTIRIGVSRSTKEEKSEVVSLLNNLSYLTAVLDEKNMLKLAKKSKVTIFKKSDVVEQSAHYVYVVLAGIAVSDDVPTTKNSPRNDSVVYKNVYPVGSVFGESSLLDSLRGSGKRRGSVLNAAMLRAGSDLYVVGVPNKDLLKMLDSKKKQLLYHELKKQSGYPEDDRWAALRQNAGLMSLLEAQFCVREFLELMDFEPEAFIASQLFQEGRGGARNEDQFFVVKSGIVRITPVFGAKSYRGGAALKVDEPHNVTAGCFVGDVNAIMKEDKSPFRVEAVTSGTRYNIERDKLLAFMDDYPGVKFQLLDVVYMGPNKVVKKAAAVGGVGVAGY